MVVAVMLATFSLPSIPLSRFSRLKSASVQACFAGSKQSELRNGDVIVFKSRFLDLVCRFVFEG